jgi:hypothetical protein
LKKKKKIIHSQRSKVHNREKAFEKEDNNEKNTLGRRLNKKKSICRHYLDFED